MNLSDYLNGAHLVDFYQLDMKSDEVIGLLGRFKMDVVYRFDRLHEGTPDEYSAAAPAEGFELRFDEHQKVITIFCYVRPRSKFSAIDPSTIGVFIPESFGAAKLHASRAGRPFSEPESGPDAQSWLRIEDVRLWVHYEFRGNELSLITLMKPWQ